MFESGIRGCISGVMGNKYIKSYIKQKCIYVFQNNLYEWAMIQNLPYGEFKV